MSAFATPTQGGSAEQSAQTTTDSAQSGSGASEAQNKPYEAPATQADLDKIIESRLARERAKYAGFDELKAKAARFDEIEQANMTEVQKLTARAEKAEAQAEQATLGLLRAQVAAEMQLPAALAPRLQGVTREELEADAKALAQLLPDVGRSGTESGGLRIKAPAGSAAGAADSKDSAARAFFGI